MKKLVLSFIFLGFLSIVTTVYAHPPQDVIIAFDLATKILKANIVHNTNNPSKHYINKVDVGLNNKEIISHSISQGDNNQGQEVLYFIPDAKAGDVISVEGYCNISGTLTKEITAK